MATGTLSNGTTVFTPKTTATPTTTSGKSGVGLAIFSDIIGAVGSVITTSITAKSNERIADKQAEAQRKVQETADLQAQIDAAKNGGGTPAATGNQGGGGSTILIVVIVVAVLGIGGYLILKKQ